MAAGLYGKTILITGASSGIGRATALEFAKYGTNLFLVARNERRLKEVADECNPKHPGTYVSYMNADLTEDDSAHKVVETAHKAFSTMNVIVNNAAALSSTYGPMLRNKHAEGMDHAYKLIIRTPWLLSALFIDDIIKNKGNIINVSSVLSTVSSPTVLAYCTMKAGLDHMSSTMAVELGQHGVRVNTVNPGIVYTRILRGFGMDDSLGRKLSKSNAAKTSPLEGRFGREIPTEDVAKTIVFLASDDAASITGTRILVDGGYTKSHPTYCLEKKRSVQQ